MLLPRRQWRTDLRASARTASISSVFGGFPWPRPRLAAVPLSASAFSSATRPEKVPDRYTLDPAERHDAVVAAPTGEAQQTATGGYRAGVSAQDRRAREVRARGNRPVGSRSSARDHRQVRCTGCRRLRRSAPHRQRRLPAVGAAPHTDRHAPQPAQGCQARRRAAIATGAAQAMHGQDRRSTGHPVLPNRPNSSPVGVSRHRASRAASTAWR